MMLPILRNKEFKTSITQVQIERLLIADAVPDSSGNVKLSKSSVLESHEACQ